MICTPDFWMALTKAINHSFHRTDGYNVVLIKATLTAIIMHDLRQFCLQMPDPEVSMRPWNILEIYQHNFFDFALHPDEHSAPDDAHSASSAQAAETMEESELLLDSAPDDVHSASSTPAAETMEESECLLGWDPDPPSDPDAPVCKF